MIRLRRLPSPGLRGQVSAMFALGALVLSLLLGVSTALLVEPIMLEQRERTSARQADINARVTQDVLLTAGPDLTETLESLHRPIASFSLVHAGGRWHSSRPSIDQSDLPAWLRDAALSGRRATERVRLATGPSLARIVPLERADATYVEVFSLVDITETMRTVVLVLLGVGTGTALLGAVLGRWAATAAVRPVAALTSAAAKVAAGDLKSRVAPSRARDLRALGDAFNQTVDDLRRRVERDTRFAADVAHELRSPLTTIVNAVDLFAARRAELPPTTREVVDLLDAEVHRFERTVTDLMEISTDTDASFHPEPVRIAELVRHAAGTTGDRPVPELGTGTEHAVVIGDKRRLERVVVNLIDNAEQHGGGVTRLAVYRDDTHAQVLVEDRGRGVPPENRGHIFERFTRGRAGTRTGGAGLGLALVAEHVRRHRGRVRVEDNPGGGARFVVELPLTPSSETLGTER